MEKLEYAHQILEGNIIKASNPKFLITGKLWSDLHVFAYTHFDDMLYKVKGKITVLSPHPGPELCSADF